MELRWSDPTPPSLEVYTGGGGAGDVLLTWAGRPADVQRWQYRYQGLPERRQRLLHTHGQQDRRSHPEHRPLVGVTSAAAQTCVERLLPADRGLDPEGAAAVMTKLLTAASRRP